jgi:hypothetical protein
MKFLISHNVAKSFTSGGHVTFSSISSGPRSQKFDAAVAITMQNAVRWGLAICTLRKLIEIQNKYFFSR